MADGGPASAGVPCAEKPAARDRRPRARGDPVPLVLLQRVLRGSHDVGPRRAAGAWVARPGAPPRAGCAGGRAQGSGAGLIEQWQRALVLAPHTDDGEFGCGGTMARLVEAGCEVRYVAFSIATRSLPDGFAPDTLAREVGEATAELGIPPERLTLHSFDVRPFPENRQAILELLFALWDELHPDFVFQPTLHDVRSEEHTSELQSRGHLVCRLLLEKKKFLPQRRCSTIRYHRFLNR